MKKKIAIIAVVIILITAGLYFFIPDNDELSIPLEESREYKYEGYYISKGDGKEIRIKAPSHRLIIEKAYNLDDKRGSFITLWAGNYKVTTLNIAKESDGLYLYMGTQSKALVIPAQVKRGEKWTFQIGSKKFEAQVKSREKIKTTLGIIPARHISFKSNELDRMELYINKDYGLVRILYSYLTGSGREEVDMILKKNEVK